MLFISPQDPAELFSNPQYQATGNLFWPDAWQAQVKEEAYLMHGLKPQATEVWGLIHTSMLRAWQGRSGTWAVSARVPAAGR